MHYIVSGATGFVGKSFVMKLLEQGQKVTVIVRNESKIPSEWQSKVSFLIADIKDLKNIGQERLCVAADCFVHMAWEGTSGKLRADEMVQMQNIIGVHDAVELAARLGCSRFVYTGSIMEYEAVKMLTFDGFEPSKGMIYSTAKLTGDFMARIWCKENEIDYVCVIISNIYGPGEKSERFLNTLIRRMIHNESIDLTHGNQLYDFVYISDAVAGIYMAADKGLAYHSYYLGNTKQYALKEFVLLAKKVLGSLSELNFGAVPYNGVPLTYTEFDVTSLEGLGFMPEVTFEQGILNCREWIKKEEK